MLNFIGLVLKGHTMDVHVSYIDMNRTSPNTIKGQRRHYLMGFELTEFCMKNRILSLQDFGPTV